jgi:uncharacterized small protein (DUF1192 family)
LFFAQAVGRVVRARGRHESATVFLPAVRPLLALAAEIEVERNHVMPPPSTDDDTALDLPLVDRDGAGTADFEALESEATFAHVLHSGRAVTGLAALKDEDVDFLGLPGLLSPQQTATLLARRDEEHRKRAHARTAVADEPMSARELSSWEAVASMRREINRLVAQVAARTSTPHGTVHALLRRAVPGPPSAAAPMDVLQKRRDHLLERLT